MVNIAYSEGFNLESFLKKAATLVTCSKKCTWYQSSDNCHVGGSHGVSSMVLALPLYHFCKAPLISPFPTWGSWGFWRLSWHSSHRDRHSPHWSEGKSRFWSKMAAGWSCNNKVQSMPAFAKNVMIIIASNAINKISWSRHYCRHITDEKAETWNG